MSQILTVSEAKMPGVLPGRLHHSTNRPGPVRTAGRGVCKGVKYRTGNQKRGVNVWKRSWK